MNVADANAEVLWHRFHDELHAFVRPRLGSGDLADDVIQTAFLRAHQSMVAGDVPAHPRAWLYQIVKRLILDTRRHRSRQERLDASLREEPLAEANELDDDRAAFAVVARALPLFIDDLEPPYRDALRMTELEGLTQAEAARRAGISLSGMKSRVQRARRQVFEALERCCELEVDARGRLIGCTARSDDRCSC